jgi:alpha-tubulin suppressor-like RCC1 family protein
MSSISCQFTYKKNNSLQDLLALNFINYNVDLIHLGPTPSPTATPTPTPTPLPILFGNGWGSNLQGQLGTGNTTSSLVPIAIGFSGGIKVSSGASHNLAIKTDGTLWAWGYNNRGQIGNNSLTNALSPIQIGSDSNWDNVFCGNSHSFGIKTDGTLWGWGWNRFGQLGDNTTVDKLEPIQIGTSTWLKVSAYLSYTLGIQTDGSLWVWGNNFDGVFCNGSRDTVNLTTSPIPVRIGFDSDWVDIAAGDRHAIAKKSNGTVYSWGYNHQGQLGNGFVYYSWVLSSTPAFANASKIYCGQDTSLVIKDDGTIWWWGFNFISSPIASPTQFETANDWVALACKGTHCLAIKSNGTLWSWGSNASGQLGDNSYSSRLYSAQITLSSTWSVISTGTSHSFALK